MRLALVSSALPPKLDGIGDYTARLAEELSRDHRVTILCGQTEAEAVAGCDVRHVFDASRPSSTLGLTEAVREANVSWVVIQYCPFSYGRWGLNPFLPLSVKRIKRTLCSPKVAITVHEPMAWPINWKLRTMNLWQGPQLRHLCRHADVVFTVVQRWAGRYKAWFGDKPIHHLPVGSNVPSVPISKKEARERLRLRDNTLLLTVFGQGHHSQTWDLAKAAARQLKSSGQDVAVLHLGPGKDYAESLFKDLLWRSDGVLPAEELSRRLAATDVFLAPFADGISTRRTTAMAALQHGLPVVSTRGDATDEVFLNADGQAMILTPADEPAAFANAVADVACDASKRGALAASAKSLYETCFSWSVIASRLVAVLQSS